MTARHALLAPLLWVASCGQSQAGGAAAPAPIDDSTPGLSDASVDSAAPADAASADATRDAIEAGARSDLDEDGVQLLHPTKPGGETWRLGAKDPNTATSFEVEQGTKVTKGTEGSLSFWNVLSHPLSYASGGTGWTTRLHIYASGVTTQTYNWKTQKGWLATPADLKNQEYTVYARGHGVLDEARLAFTLKIRGGKHTTDGDLASCTMMVLTTSKRGSASFGKELHHPDYDYVKLTPTSATSLTDNTWYGLKLVSYQRAGESSQVHYELWIDRAPFDAAGKPRNNWEKFSEYLDVEGTSTGLYSKLADWGGMLTTFRTDGWHDLDFTLLSVREIVAP